MQREEGNLDSVFFKDIVLAFLRPFDPGFLQDLLGGFLSLLAVIPDVVVGDTGQLDGTSGEDLHKIRRAPEAVPFPLALLGLAVGEDAFKIDKGDIVLFKQVAEIGKEVIMSFPGRD